jgi:small-conductance mechanosensitive channel
MGFWITNPADKGGMTSKVNRAIWRLLQEQNIEVPYPQAEVRIKNSGEGAAE